MRAFVRITTIGLVSASVALMIGCDNRSSRQDANVRSAIAQATAQRAGRSSDSTDKASKILASAAGDTGALPSTRAQLAAMQGQIQLEAAIARLREIDQKELELSRVSFNLSQLAVQLDTATVIAGGYNKYDPKVARDKIGEHILAAQGGPDKATWEYQSLELPTLAAVKQKISELEGQIAKLEEESRSLTEKRDSAQKESDKELQLADTTKGEESIEHFKKMSELRRQAGDLYTQIEATNARTTPFKDDLSVQQGQLEVINNVIKALMAHQESLDTGWKSMVQQIDAQNALSKQMIGSSSTAAPTTGPVKEGTSISEKAGDIARLSSELAALRTQAQTDLDDAATHFNQAYTFAESARHDLMTLVNETPNKERVDVKAANLMIDTINPLSYRLQEGVARRLIGSLYASQAASMMNMANLQESVGDVIKKANATAPAEFISGAPRKDANTAASAADDAFNTASGIFSGISDGVPIGKTGADLQRAAAVENILTLYGRSQVAHLSGADPKAKEYLDLALVERGKALEKQAKLPALPPALTPAPPPEAAPATQPEAAPATQPEGTAAPAAEPAAEPTAEPATQPG